MPGVIIAIDLGTSGIGMAIAFPNATVDAEPSPPAFYVPGKAQTGNAKAPTTVLLDSSGERLIAIGTSARTQFLESTQTTGASLNYLFFDRFKMALAKRDGRSLMDVRVLGAGADREVPIMLPFSMLLRAVKDEALVILRNLLASIPRNEIRWVLTVPAIFDDESKDFYRKAAIKAGLIDDAGTMGQLQLVLEPEAAIVAASAPPSPFRDALRVGTKIMTVDLGGGTADITVNEVSGTRPLKLKQLLPASGGAWGGTAVDALFLTFMKELLGAANWENLSGASRVELLYDWEKIKLEWTNAGAASLPTSSLANGLGDCMSQQEVVDALRSACNGYNVTHGLHDLITVNKAGTALRLPQDVVRGFFVPVIGSVVKHVTELLRSREAAGLRQVLLAGGLSDSPFVTAYFMEQIAAYSRAINVVTVAYSGLLVTRGAAYFGLAPNGFISSRVVRYTYAYRASQVFDPAIHDARKATLVNDDGVKYASQVLLPLIQIGKEVQVTEPVSHTVTPLRASDTSIGVNFYRLSRPIIAGGKAVYADSPGAERIGSLTVDCTVHGRAAVPVAQREIVIQVYFGRSEIAATAEFVLTKAKASVVLTYA